MGWVLIAAGIFSAVCAIANWDWFMEHRKARMVVSLMGRNGARVVYVMLGATLTVLGGLLTLGVLR